MEDRAGPLLSPCWVATSTGVSQWDSRVSSPRGALAVTTDGDRRGNQPLNERRLMVLTMF